FRTISANLSGENGSTSLPARAAACKYKAFAADAASSFVMGSWDCPPTSYGAQAYFREFPASVSAWLHLLLHEILPATAAQPNLGWHPGQGTIARNRNTATTTR